MKTLILASASPRRRDLLRRIGLSFEVIPSRIPEEWEEGLPPRETAKKMALKKAEQVATGLDSGIVIGADTLVVLDGTPIGKPQDPQAAFQLLQALSGKTHDVITAVALVNAEDGSRLQEEEVTRVFFRTLSEREISRYVASGEPLDKAGAYGIQGRGALLVQRIEGCYTNVVGLPLARLAGMLRSMGIEVV